MFINLETPKSEFIFRGFLISNSLSYLSKNIVSPYLHHCQFSTSLENSLVQSRFVVQAGWKNAKWFCSALCGISPRTNETLYLKFSSAASARYRWWCLPILRTTSFECRQVGVLTPLPMICYVAYWLWVINSFLISTRARPWNSIEAKSYIMYVVQIQLLFESLGKCGGARIN